MRLITTIIALIFGFAAQAQEVDPTREYKPMHFGISIAMCQAKMKTTFSPSFYQTTDSLYSITNQGFPGVGFGGVLAFRLSEHLEFRTLAMLHLLQRNMQFQFKDRKDDIKLETVSFDIPVGFKYKSDRHKNTRFYVLGGARWTHDFQSNEDADLNPVKPIVASKKNVYYYEFGSGVEFHLEYVMFGLELKMSNSLNNALVKVPGSTYSGSLNSMNPRIFQLSLLFEY
ncbi:MAG: hypothetical protein RLZZ370_1387 [Bacteroidota bacterium]